MGVMPLYSRRPRTVLLLVIRVLLTLGILTFILHHITFELTPPTYTKTLVVASNATERDASWLTLVPLDWSIYHYISDKPTLPSLSVPVNKGNEAMVYLTYIIDHYESLPDVVFFHHDHDRAWHQAFDSVFEVSNLRPSYVMEKGYVSPRCLRGCENIILLSDEKDVADMEQMHLVPRDVQLRSFLTEFLDENEAVPPKIAAPCCAQFAASRGAIQARTLEWWVRMRQWLIDTPLRSYNSGRLLEYTWHIWLGEQAQFCSYSKEDCLCKVFGHGDNCDITDQEY
ncbi:hypothetical protein BJ170DRAFT_381067 [Xylariales sp. AK1849]|nr:hypothetical protein BJ170DRAFT_381067 [Xylariales sp. AK1849]